MKNNIKESWMHKYSLAKAYFEYHGNLEISQSYKTLNGYEYSEEGIALGTWITNQRQAYKGMGNCKITEEQINLLEEIGMRFETNYKEKEWNKKYAIIKEKYRDSIDNLHEYMNDILYRNIIPDKNTLIRDSVEIFDRFETSYELFDALQVLKQTDVSTMAHSMNVSIIARLIGVWAGLDTEKLDEISMAGLLHDIGKFKIPDEILLKPGKLTKEEFEVIKKHTVYGYEILNNFKILESTKRAALLHHEKFDGSGYPFGYTADKIDDISAIITIADVYDAMTSKRCYRDGMCPFDVIEDFEYDGISKYHPKYIGMFLKKIASSYIGSTVLLTNGKKAKIIFVTEKYSRPTVTLLEDNSVLVLKDEKDIKIAAVL